MTTTPLAQAAELAREALVLAEDVLARSPFSTALWPDGTHPNAGIGKIREAIAVLASQAVAVAEPVGLSLTQEPKYTVNGSAIVNRASGEAIPADEPVFIFRARDRHAREALEAYACVIAPGEHRDAVVSRVADFAAFGYAHPERMKEPDTASPPVQAPAEVAPTQSPLTAPDWQAGGSLHAQITSAIIDWYEACGLGESRDKAEVVTLLFRELAATPQPQPPSPEQAPAAWTQEQCDKVVEAGEQLRAKFKDARMAPEQAQAKQDVQAPTHRHLRRGTLYTELHRGFLQTDAPLTDMMELVVYAGDDGRVWCRPVSEFDDDERFAVLAAPTSPTPGAAPPVQGEPDSTLPTSLWLNDMGTSQKLSFSPIAGASEHHEYRRAQAPAPSVPTQELTDGTKLWLWKNGDHYLAFTHEYPRFEPAGDPMVLGNPAATAVFKKSFNRNQGAK